MGDLRYERLSLSSTYDVRVVNAWSRDEIILACDLVCRNGWRELRPANEQVQELSRLLRSLPTNAEAAQVESFRSVNSISRKTADIATQHPDYAGKPTRGNRLDREVLESFLAHPDDMVRVAAALRRAWVASIATEESPFETDELDDLAVPEGGTVMAAHLRRERNPALRRRKIEAVLRVHGALACEVCSFDFGSTYPGVGEGYIEVHHIRPLHDSGRTETRLTDLATLCSNCHSMIHRRRPWLTPTELRELVRKAG